MPRLDWRAPSTYIVMVNLALAACAAPPRADPLPDPPDAAWKQGAGDDGGAAPAEIPSPADGGSQDVATGGTGIEASSGDDGAADSAAEAAPSPAEAGAPDAATQPEAAPPHEAAAACTIASCGARSVCAGVACLPARRVFVSSATYTGSLGGATGADAKCQSLAGAAGLGGTWMAWVSDSSSSPSTRFTLSAAEYRLLDGTLVAAGWSALTSGSLSAGIALDEHGQPFTGTSETWTATYFDGTLYASGCNDFKSGSHGATNVTVGIATETGVNWTDVYFQYCDRTDHLYCFEQ
jgi:hypothetical protein